MNEREEKWLQFEKSDRENNHGLIIDQYSEVQLLMKEPVKLHAFIESDLTNLLTYVSRHSEFYKQYENFQKLEDFPIVNKEILK